MLGLFGTLNLATRSLSTQRQGTEVAGHNLANVNNPAYARQRLTLTTGVTVPDTLGPQGTGAEAVSIVQLRNALLDRQILGEAAVIGSLESQQRTLEYAQTNLGQLIDRQTTGAEGAASSGGVGGQHGLAEEMSSLFNSFQSLSTNPTSTAERQVLLLKAQTVATQFNQVSTRLGELNSLLNESLSVDVESANRMITEIAQLNEQIISVEVGGAVANDLRDIRQQRLEELGKLVKVDTVGSAAGSIDLSIDGVAMTSGRDVLDQLEVYDPGTGQLGIRARSAGTPLTLTGGSIQGTMESRDGALATLRSEVNTIAANLITEVNAVHSRGFSLSGTTGAAFFTGTGSANIQVNSTLLADPNLIQASSVAGANGNNEVVLELAQLASRKIVALGDQTFGHAYGQTVAKLGQSLASVTTQIDNQNNVDEMLKRQRDSFSGVSLDEEMTDLIKFQKAFEASARLVSIVDEMLDVVIGMKR